MTGFTFRIIDAPGCVREMVCRSLWGRNHRISVNFNQADRHGFQNPASPDKHGLLSLNDQAHGIASLSFH
jgi:hypothetical protein